MATTIASKINQETLRKYLNSLSVNGFSGVSRGQKTNIQTADNALIINNAV